MPGEQRNKLWEKCNLGKVEEVRKALEEFNKALEMDENDPTIYFNRGNVYLN